MNATELVHRARFSWRSCRSSRSSATPIPANLRRHVYNVCSLTPSFRHTSLIGVPASACRSA